MIKIRNEHKSCDKNLNLTLKLNMPGRSRSRRHYKIPVQKDAKTLQYSEVKRKEGPNNIRPKNLPHFTSKTKCASILLLQRNKAYLGKTAVSCLILASGFSAGTLVEAACGRLKSSFSAKISAAQCFQSILKQLKQEGRGKATRNFFLCQFVIKFISGFRGGGGGDGAAAPLFFLYFKRFYNVACTTPTLQTVL